MAALDFGMALARGMLPKLEAAQKDLINLAGGRNVFKSEDWWNKAVDKQISEGYRTVERQDKEFLMPSGEYQPGKRETSSYFYRNNSPFGTQYYNSGSGYWGMMNTEPSYNPIFGYSGGWQRGTSVSYKAPEGAVFTVDPRTKEKQYTSRDFDVFGKREDYTAGELKDIETSARRGAEQAKRTAAESKATRKKRGTGGVLAKARVEGAAPATGLPALGEGGLGITGSILGGGIKL
jgi:hypothetical protein